MRNKIFLPLILLFGFSLFQISCGSNQQEGLNGTTKGQEVNSASKDFEGIFSGVTPCADCPGIETTVYFNPDSTFIETLKYLERNSSFSDTGKWRISDKIITVSFPGDQQERYFGIKSDSAISMLNAEKKEIKGPLSDKFILKRN